MHLDIDLVNKMKNGEEKAFEVIFTRYFSGLCLYAVKVIKSDVIAEEIVEDLFLKIWEDCQSLEIKTSVRAYLYRSVHNRCLKYLRHLKVEQNYNDSLHYSLTDEMLYQPVSDDYPIANLISMEIEKEVEKAIGDLPAQCRECFCLHRFEELTYPEIAEKLGISINTVKTQMTRALQKLRIALKDFLPMLFL